MNLEPFANYFNENVDTCTSDCARTHMMARWLFSNTSREMHGQHPGTNLPDPQGVLPKEVPSHAISAANSEVAVLHPSASKKVRGTYLKMSAEKKAKTGNEQQSTEC